MNLKELFEKIYNGEITKNDVIKVICKDGDEEYIEYILNDDYDFWDKNGVKSLSFFKNSNTDTYSETFFIIAREEYEKILNEEYKKERIKRLEEELAELKGEK